MGDTVHIRCDHACGSSLGYRWPTPGAVVEVDPRHAPELLAIPFGGFSVAEAPAKQETPAKQVREVPVEVTEPAPENHRGAQVTEPAPKPSGRRTAKG